MLPASDVAKQLADRLATRLNSGVREEYIHFRIPGGARLHRVLPASDVAKQFADRLATRLKSDSREEYTQLRIPGGARMVDWDAWTESVALDLLPSAVGIFPSHR